MHKMVDENQINWHTKLYDAMWVDGITRKRMIGMSPFQLVFGTEAKLPILLELSSPCLQKVLEDYEFKDALEKRMLYLTKMKEERELIIDRIKEHQLRVKKLFDTKTGSRQFKVGDFVLLWEKRRELKGLLNKFNS